MTIKEIETLIEHHENMLIECQSIIERVRRYNVADKSIVKLEQTKHSYIDTVKALTLLKHYKTNIETLERDVVRKIETKVFEWFKSHKCEYMSIEDILFLLLDVKEIL